jgi:eukaryotic-like serine/threonine-protein kinase
MPMSAGTRLGPYEIVSLLGAGGMGEVYKARDTRLSRTIAIKVLPSELVDSPAAKQRFEREARAVAALSHPHICPVFDVGQQDGTEFLVMEYLEGETLAARLARATLPLEQALHYAIQIADALATAHKAGIVHRDLKPGNIMLTRSGAKLLDFGLAKACAGPLIAGATEVATERALTATGTVVGTVQYMAPEQIEGGEIDARTDIFAFGTVLYEMVTGRKPFEGKTAAGLMAAILERTPVPVSTRKPTVSPVLDHVIGKCLAKDPDNRWQTARDMTLELKWVADAQASTVIPTAGARRRRLALWVAALAGAATTLILGAWLWRRPTSVPPDAGLTVFQIPPPRDTVLGQVAVSPDGQSVAFVAADANGSGHIYIRQRDSFTTRQLAGTEGASSPFWSPDNRFIGFFAQTKLRKVAVAGGPAQTLCDAFGALGAAWNAEGTIIFGADGPLRKVSGTGGDPTVITTLSRAKDVLHCWPSFLPDGRHFLFNVRSERATENGVYVGSLDSASIKPVVKADLRALYSPPGHLLFIRDRTLLAQNFDTTRLQVSGDPVVLAGSVGYIWDGSDAGLSVSPSGVLAYESAEYPVTELAWFDRNGRKVGRVGEPADYLNPWLASDERQVVVERIDPNTGVHQIWKLDLTRNGSASRLTLSPMGRHVPVLSSDGHRMVYISNDSGQFEISLIDLRQPEREDVLLSTSANNYPVDWSLDGRFILYETLDARTRRDLWVLPLVGDRRPRPLLQSDFDEQQGQLSPDGRWMAYISNETGRWEVYVRSFPGLGNLHQISTAGGTQPRWRRDGKELFYLAADRTLMAVPLGGGGATTEPATPRPLFRLSVAPSGVPTGVRDRTRFAASADGQRFLINATLEGAGPREIRVVTYWPGLLRGR